MNPEELNMLFSPSFQALVKEFEHEDPAQLVLKMGHRIPDVHLLAEQVLLRKKAQAKLPHWVASGCVFLRKSLEQSGSEAVMQLKSSWKGKSLLDLTAGCGVDTWNFSKYYDEITSVEQNPALFHLLALNLERLNIHNVSLTEGSAETFVGGGSPIRFDTIYLDPDRRAGTVKRGIRFDECNPNVVELMPALLKRSNHILIKASPMIDISAGIDQLGVVSRVIVLATGNECKEVLFEVNQNTPASQPIIEARFLYKNDVFSFDSGTQVKTPSYLSSLPESGYLYEADVSLYKAGIVDAFYSSWFEKDSGGMNVSGGYFFSEREYRDFPGRKYILLETMRFKPRSLSKYLKKRGIKQVNYTRKRFDIPVSDIISQVKIPEGGEHTLVFTKNVQGERLVLLCKRLP